MRGSRQHEELDWKTVAEAKPGALDASLDALRHAAEGCRACELWKRGTQTVFGAGSERSAAVVLVGEQPGDQEDRSGQPFVGPAGRVLDAALTEAGIDRSDVYVTNAVKHFKWTARGKRRIHEKPSPNEVRACRFWLDAELAVLKPHVVVCLGATAAQALLGRDFRVLRDRGKLRRAAFAELALATVHPSSLLRIRDRDDRRAAHARLVEDLGQVSRALAER